MASEVTTILCSIGVALAWDSAALAPAPEEPECQKVTRVEFLEGKDFTTKLVEVCPELETELYPKIE